jgi:hypothetical protein
VVEIADRVKRLEELRQEKRHQEILDSIPLGEKIDDFRLLPICFDAARGIVRRSLSVGKIRDTFFQLNTIADGYWNNSDYIQRVDENPDLAVSHRRDLSRFFWEIAPVIDDDNQIFRNNSLDLLKSVDGLIPEGDWKKSLVEIERAKYNRRVDLDKLLGALSVVTQSPESNADAKKAVLDWSMEAVMKQRPWSVSKVFLAAEYDNHKFSKKEKTIQILRTVARVVHKQIRDKVIKINQWSLGTEDKVSISNQLIDVYDVWEKQKV